jgi:DNA-directed RNA polymerase subunit RPC12/RpoP
MMVVPGALSAAGDVLHLDDSSAGEGGDGADLLGIPCMLCQTRIYVPRSAIGGKVRCPDCHAVNAIVEPKPEPPRKRRPAAMEGPQYQVYEGESQPWGVDLARAAPQSIHLVCDVCQTHLVATVEQVGKRLVCPDCGAKTLVKPPKAEPPPRSVLVETGPEFEVEAASETPDLGLYESYLKAPPLEHRLRQEAGADTPEGARAAAGHAMAPPNAMWSGLVPFLRSPGVLTVWLAIAAGLAGLLLMGVVSWYFLAMGGMATAIALALSLFGGIAVIAWFAMAVSLGSAIVESSSMGADRVHHWPGREPWDFLGELPRGFVALCAIVGSGALVGGAIDVFETQLAPIVGEGAIEIVPAALGALGQTLVAPVVILSQLAADAWWCVVSWQVVRTICRRPLPWLALWLQSLVLGWVVICGIAAPFAIALKAPLFGVACGFLACGLFSAAWVVYARQLGRLAWVLASDKQAEVDAADEDEDDD